MADRQQEKDEDKDLLETNTRPSSDIFDDDQPSLTPDDDLQVDLGDVPADERTLDDQIAADKDEAKDSADAKKTLDEEGIVVDDDEAEPDGERVEKKREPYGKRAQKAINKANSLKKSAETRAAAAERKLADVQHREEEVQGERIKSAVRRHETDIAESETALERLRGELPIALENGESKDQARITEEMTDAKIKIRESNYSLDRAKHAEADHERRGTAAEQRGNGQRETPQATKDWLTRNRGWYGNEDNFLEASAANAIERRVAVEHANGAFTHGPDTREYWDEVDQRLNKAHPDLDIADLDEGADPDGDEEPRPRPAARKRATSPGVLFPARVSPQ